MEFDITINEVRLRVSQQNSFPNRPTIVFLHDSLGCIKLWRDFPQQLGEATQCNVLIYDRQGYGQSAGFAKEKRGINYLELEADTLIQVLAVIKVNNPILFGHSDGGSIALIAAGKYPDNIQAIITEGAHVFVEDVTLSGIRDGVKAYETTKLKERLIKYHGDNTDAMFWAWAETWLRDEFLDWNIEHFLPQIQCPSLIIQGMLDEYGTKKQVDAIVNGVGEKAKKLMIPNIGHTPHKEARGVILLEAIKFIVT